jgi:hypothetical protein
MSIAWTLLPLLAATPPTPDAARVTEWAHQAFGDTAFVVDGFQPSSVTGDFNGDGTEDLALVVTITKGLAALPKGVTVLRPYGYEEPEGATPAPTIGARFVAIIHGQKSGEETVPKAAYLFAGGSPVLVVQSRRTAENLQECMAVVRRKRKPKEEVPLDPPKAARGDSLFLATEAAGGLVFWNGKTYRWYESPED